MEAPKVETFEPPFIKDYKNALLSKIISIGETTVLYKEIISLEEEDAIIQ